MTSGSYREGVMSGSYGGFFIMSGSYEEVLVTSDSYGNGVITSGSYCECHDVR